MKVLIIGATGQLGSELCSVLADGFEVIPAEALAVEEVLPLGQSK